MPQRKTQPTSPRLSRESLHLAKEVRSIQHRAAEHDGRIVRIGPLVFFSTDTGDAWMLEPADQLAARLAVGGDPLPVHIEESETSFAIGWQGRYQFDGDAFVDVPAGPGAFTGQLVYNTFDGDVTLRTLPKQHDILLELGYLISALKLTPVLQFSNHDVVDTTTGDENHWSVGLNYWWAGHNANVKGAYSRIKPSGLASQNGFTLQLQLFYF